MVGSETILLSSILGSEVFGTVDVDFEFGSSLDSTHHSHDH